MIIGSWDGWGGCISVLVLGIIVVAFWGALVAWVVECRGRGVVWGTTLQVGTLYWVQEDFFGGQICLGLRALCVCQVRTDGALKSIVLTDFRLSSNLRISKVSILSRISRLRSRHICPITQNNLVSIWRNLALRRRFQLQVHGESGQFLQLIEVLLRKLALVLVIVCEEDVLANAREFVFFNQHGIARICTWRGDHTFLHFLQLL